MAVPSFRGVISLLGAGWLIPLFYVAFLLTVYIKFGFLVQFTLGAGALAVVPVVAYIRRSSEFLKSSALFVTLLLTYEGLQGITGLLVTPGSIVSLAGVDQMIFGFNFDSAVQATFASNTATIISAFFYGTHFALIILAVTVFWFTSKSVFRGYSRSMVLTSYLALLTFVIVPSAPPWFVGSAKNLLSSSYGMLPSWLGSVQKALLSIESDKFAAFPSLHAAYVTLFSVYAIKLNPKYGLLSLPVLIGVYFSVLYLGQHYVVDLIGGAAYSLGSVLVVEKLIPRLRGHAAQV